MSVCSLPRKTRLSSLTSWAEVCLVLSWKGLSRSNVFVGTSTYDGFGVSLLCCTIIALLMSAFTTAVAGLEHQRVREAADDRNSADAVM